MSNNVTASQLCCSLIPVTISGLQLIPWDSKDNDTAATLVPHTTEVNKIL